MKKMIVLLVFVASINICFAQDTANHKTQPLSAKEEYMKMSKRQKTAAIILVSAGTALYIAGVAILNHDAEEDLEYNNATVAVTMALTGTFAVLGSIPLFISAGKNRKRARSISFKNESVEMIQGNIVHFRSLPSINFRISL